MLQSPWQISLLGGFSIRQRSVEGSRSTSTQVAELLAMLADRVGRQVSRSELIEELWPNADGDAGRNRFRVLLAAVRRLLEPPGTPSGSVLICDRTVVALSSNGCLSDVDEFQRHLQIANSSTSVETRMQHYKAADELYGGDFMSGRAGEWIDSRRAGYSRLQGLAQFRYSALLEESGDLATAMLQIHRSIEADPLREAPRRRCLRLLVEAGEIGAALTQYDEFRAILKKSVGLVPTAEFQDWVKEIKGGAGPKRPPGNVESISLSTTTETPPSPEPAESARVFLPPRLTSLIGRSADIAELSDLLPLYRWITLVGPGGVGKTRLAIETARANVGQFGAGVFYVPVGDAPKPSLILETILQQIRLEPSAEPLDTLRRYLAQPVESGRNACLFVFDGIDQFSVETNQVVMRLLAEVPNATILATARKGRGAPGEHEYPLRPLEIPDPDAPEDRLMANPTVQLFMERARSASPRFALTRANAREFVFLCRGLEGVPLAIELAAAQAGTLTPGNMLKALGDVGALNDPKSWREPRHRSIRASLEFSLESLDARKQDLFCSLCVFPGTFEASAAGIIAGASSSDLIMLAEHSLLSQVSDAEHRRFSMLGMVREFGWSKLSAGERGKVQERHAAYFCRLVADAETLHLNSGIQQLPRVRLELENIRATAEWAIRKRDVQSATSLALGLASVWIYAGFQQEGREYVSRIRASFRLSEMQAACLDAAEGILACFQDDPETGRDRICRALPVFEAAGMQQLASGIRWTLAYAAYLSGDFEGSVAVASQMQPVPGTPTSRWHTYRRNLLGFAYCELGRLDEAERLLQECLQNWHELGDFVPADFCRLNLARVTWKRGRLEDAWREYQDVTAAFGRWNERRGMAYATEGLGRVAADLGRYAESARLLGAAQRLRESIGLRRDFADAEGFERAVDASCAALGPTYTSEWQAGYGISPDRVPHWISGLD